MMWKKHVGPRAIAVAVALLMAAPPGTLAAPVYAQAGPPGGQGAPTAPEGQAAAPVQVPQPDQGGVNWSGVGYGAAAIASNVVYIPAKLVYAVLGGLVGGASYLLTVGNSQTADTIWRSSLGGDYVVTPAMLQGSEPVHFSGPTATPPEQAGGVQPITQSAAAPSGQGASGSAASAPGSQPIDSGATGTAGTGGAPPRTLPNTSIE